MYLTFFIIVFILIGFRYIYENFLRKCKRRERFETQFDNLQNRVKKIKSLSASLDTKFNNCYPSLNMSETRDNITTSLDNLKKELDNISIILPDDTEFKNRYDTLKNAADKMFTSSDVGGKTFWAINNLYSCNDLCTASNDTTIQKASYYQEACICPDNSVPISTQVSLTDASGNTTNSSNIVLCKPIVTSYKYVLYGPWIGTSFLPVDKILYDGNRIIYLAKDVGADNIKYTKMVDSAGVSKYYIGDIGSFDITKWDTYSDAGDNYRVKRCPSHCQSGCDDYTMECSTTSPSTYKYFMYGPGITYITPVNKIITTIDFKTIYLAQDFQYTKMVDNKGVAKNYTGNVADFDATKWDTYTDAGDNYRIRRCSASCSEGCDESGNCIQKCPVDINSKNVSDECLQYLWKQVGCINPYTEGNSSWWKTQTKQGVINDMNSWATLCDSVHLTGCYGTNASNYPARCKVIQSMSLNNSIINTSRTHIIVFESNGNLVIYKGITVPSAFVDKENAMIWNSGTNNSSFPDGAGSPPSTLTFGLNSNDGNLLSIYSSSPFQMYWNNGSRPGKNAKIIFEDNGTLSVYNEANAKVWSNSSLQKPAAVPPLSTYVVPFRVSYNDGNLHAMQLPFTLTLNNTLIGIDLETIKNVLPKSIILNYTIKGGTANLIGDNSYTRLQDNSNSAIIDTSKQANKFTLLLSTSSDNLTITFNKFYILTEQTPTIQPSTPTIQPSTLPVTFTINSIKLIDGFDVYKPCEAPGISSIQLPTTQNPYIPTGNTTSLVIKTDQQYNVTKLVLTFNSPQNFSGIIAFGKDYSSLNSKTYNIVSGSNKIEIPYSLTSNCFYFSIQTWSLPVQITNLQLS